MDRSATALRSLTDDAPPVPARVRVALADDNAVVRMGVRSLLATADDLEVVGEASNGLEAVALVRRTKPDVVLLDVRMPKQDGVNAAMEIADLTAVVMLTYSESPEVISAAVRAGARGYLVHGHFDEDELLQAVRLAAGGLGTFSALAVRALSNPAPGRAALAQRYGLSGREVDIMELVARGAANREIAAELFIAEKTVKNHINRLFAKLGVTSRGQAVALWLSVP